MKEPCDNCGGTGLIKCGVCQGTGLVRVRVSPLEGGMRTRICNHCTEGDKICPTCRGTGRKPNG